MPPQPGPRREDQYGYRGGADPTYGYRGARGRGDPYGRPPYTEQDYERRYGGDPNMPRHAYDERMSRGRGPEQGPPPGYGGDPFRSRPGGERPPHMREEGYRGMPQDMARAGENGTPLAKRTTRVIGTATISILVGADSVDGTECITYGSDTYNIQVVPNDDTLVLDAEGTNHACNICGVPNAEASSTMILHPDYSLEMPCDQWQDYGVQGRLTPDACNFLLIDPGLAAVCGCRHGHDSSASNAHGNHLCCGVHWKGTVTMLSMYEKRK